MMVYEPTIMVEKLNDLPAIRMTWKKEIETADIRQSFRAISAHLDNAEKQLYVIVDLSSQPQMPIAETIVSALAGPFRHNMLAEWLVVGSSGAAQQIENMLSRVTGRSNVQWFDSEEAVLDYITAPPPA